MNGYNEDGAQTDLCADYFAPLCPLINTYVTQVVVSTDGWVIRHPHLIWWQPKLFFQTGCIFILKPLDFFYY